MAQTRVPTPNVHPGQRVITRSGTAAVVAFTDARGTVYVHGPRGVPVPAAVVCDAWGGEASLEFLGAFGAAQGPHCGRSARRLQLAA